MDAPRPAPPAAVSWPADISEPAAAGGRLFRFAEPEAAARPRPAAWKAPVAMCAAAVLGTAGLIAAVLPAGDRTEPDTAAAVPAAGGGDGGAVPVVSALHLSDGRPVRAVPVDTLPEETGDLWTAGSAPPSFDGLFVPPARPAAPSAGPAPVRTAAADRSAAAPRRVAPAVWLTGEIRP